MINKIIKLTGFFAFIFTFVLIFNAIAFAQAAISGVCPFPTEIKIKINGTSYGYDEIVVIDEDTPMNVEFVAVPFAGNSANKDTANEIPLTSFVPGAVDSSTTNVKDWQPVHNPNHVCSRPDPVSYSCWTPAGSDANLGDSHLWTANSTGGVGWKINEIKFWYNTDFFKIGNNNNETANNCTPFTYTYNVPSVPDAYIFYAWMSMRWEWDCSLKHRWKHTGQTDTQGGPNDADGNPTSNYRCDTCGSTAGLNEILEIPHTLPKYINTPLSQEISSNGSILWDTSQVQNGDGGIPGKRQNYLNYRNNPPNGLGPLSDGVHPGVVGKVLTVRVRVVVRDKKNIAHVQTGFSGDNILKAQNGQKVSDTDDHKKLTVRFVDNNPNAIATKLTGGSSIMPLGDLPANADCKDENFKMIFWYEWPIYQYSSHKLFDYTEKDPATGVEILHNFCSVLYSPMFVWKKGKVWTKMSDFIKDTNNSSSPPFKLFKDGVEVTESPDFIVYEGTFPLNYLFTSSDTSTSKEDIVGWHYAKTSLGDSFGNPAYDRDKDSSPLYNTYKPNGKELQNFFKYPPVNYKNGKGPLKYFFEIRDASGNGGGTGEINFNCNETYFSDFPDDAAKAYTHPQLKFNSDIVKYMVKSTEADLGNPLKTDGYPMSTIELPGDDSSYCASEDYSGDPIQSKWKDCAYIKQVLNPNVESPNDKILNYYQAWGKIEIEDKIKPNIGIYIQNTVKQDSRRIYMEDGLETLHRGASSKLEQFNRTNLDANPERQTAIIDKVDKYNYVLLPDTYIPNPNPPANSAGKINVPFDDLRDEWVFDKIPEKDGKLFEGDEGNQDTTKEGYGFGKDIQLIVKHQDLCEVDKKAYFVPYYAYDNIDGQRIPDKTGQNFVLTDWYKGVAADNNTHNTPNNPVFASDMINQGFVTWAIKDENYDQATADSIYKVGNYYMYPKLTVSNVNIGWDCKPLNGGKEITLSYAVIDKNKNHRKIRVNLFVAPTDMSIVTIEKYEKRNE